MLAIESLARRRPHDRHAVRNRLLKSRKLLAGVHDVRGVHGETLALVPAVLQVRGREPQVTDAHVGHRPAGRADVPGIERSDEDDANVV